MRYLLNIGNTHTQIAPWFADGIGKIRTLATTAVRPEIFPAEAELFCAGVVPEVRRVLEENMTCFFLENAHAAAAGLDLSQADVSTLGADRLANAIELRRRFPGEAAATVDFGTAITIEIVDAAGAFRGGAILPGRKLMRQALFSGTAQLPELPYSAELPDEPGLDTAGSMRFGIDRGAIGAVRELLNVIRGIYHPEMPLLAVGGDAGFFAAAIPQLQCAAPDFTLQGIRFAATCR